MAKAKRPYFKVVTPPVTAAFVHVHERDTEGEYASDRYSITTHLPPESDTAKAIIDALNKARDAEWPEGAPAHATAGYKVIDDPESPFHGLVRFQFKTNDDDFPSHLTLPGGKPIPLRDDGKPAVRIGGGDTVRIAGAAAAFVAGKNVGTTLYLNAVRLVEKRVVDDFGDEPTDDEETGEPTGKQNFNF